MSGEIEVRAAREATDEVLAAFGRLIPQLSTAKPPDRAALARVLAAPSNTVLLAHQRGSGRIVGMLTLVTFPTATATRAWIEDVVVDEAARGRGVGEALTREALRLAAERGARTVELTSRPSRAAANRLYERAGFARRETNLYRYVLPGDDPGA